MLAIVAVPEASVNEDRGLLCDQDDIRAARQLLSV